MSTPVQGPWGEIETSLDFGKARPELGGLTLDELRVLAFSELARYKQAGVFAPGYPADTAIFYSPRDPGVHAVDAWVALQVTHSWEINMYGFDDPLLAALTRHWCEQRDVLVIANLDKSQAGGVHEKQLLDAFLHDQEGNSVAIGQSTRGAISHLKVTVADKRIKSGGSTNMSEGGEEKQDNELIVTTNPALAAEASSIVGLNHDAMLAQMAKAATKGA